MKGFTLIELMITIVVLAIIATMATPSFSKMIAKQKLNSTTNDLMATFTLARSQAVLMHKPMTVTLNATSPESRKDPTLYYWQPAPNNKLTAPAVTSVTFKQDGTLKDITHDTEFVVCNTVTGTTKTFSLGITNGVYVTPSQDGSCL